MEDGSCLSYGDNKYAQAGHPTEELDNIGYNFKIKGIENSIISNYKFTCKIPDNDRIIFNSIKSSTIFNEYRVENDKFGLIEGRLNREEDGSYSRANWDIAYNNMEAIKAIFKYASEMGYSKIIFERGDYSLCLRNPKGAEYLANSGWEIFVPSNMEIDFNGSTFRTIYDSDHRMPYDNDTVREPWRLSGTLFRCYNVENTIIRNGIILGDKYERSFTNPTERTLDMGVGFLIEASSKNVTFENLDISGMMADAIAANASTDGQTIIYGGDANCFFTRGNYTSASVNGERIPDSKNQGIFTTDIYHIPNGYNELMINADYDYYNFPNFNNEIFRYIWFDENKTYLGFAESTYLQTIFVPNNAKYFALCIMGEPLNEFDTTIGETADKRKKNFVIAKPISEFVTIRDCYIHENHRGGIANCANDTLIERCRIINNGNTLGDKPQFTDTTRYAINCEDNVSRMVTIRDCIIQNHFNTVIFSCLNLIAENNYISQCSTSAFIVYQCYSCKLNNNFVSSAASLLGWAYVSDARIRNVIITNNTAYVDNPYNINRNIYSNCNIISSGNKFFGLPSITGGENFDFIGYDHVIQLTNRSINSLNVVETIKDSSGNITTEGMKEAVLKNVNITLPDQGNSDVIIHLNLENPKTENVNIDLGGFNTYLLNSYNAKINKGYLMYHYSANQNVYISNTKLSWKKFRAQYHNNLEYQGSIIFKDSKIDSKNYEVDYSYQYFMDFNSLNAPKIGSKLLVKFEDCEIDLSTFNNQYPRFINHKFIGENTSVELQFVRCKLTLPVNDFRVQQSYDYNTNVLIEDCTYGNDFRFFKDENNANSKVVFTETTTIIDEIESGDFGTDTIYITGINR